MNRHPWYVRTARSRENRGLPVSWVLMLCALLGIITACSLAGPDSVDPSYAPDGPYLHEVIKPATSRQHKPFAILLCRAADVSSEPLTVNTIKQFFFKDGQGTGNIYDYFLNMSYGSIDLDGSQIYTGPIHSSLNDRGWYTMSSTRAELLARDRTTRGQTETECQSAAKSDGFDPTRYVGVVDIINVPTDSGSVDRNVVVGYPTDEGGELRTFALTFLEHEMGHALGLAHSMSITMDTGPVHSWSPGGEMEYGDCWDIMSQYSCHFQFQQPGYTYTSGPELEAGYRDKLGWIPPERIYTYSGSGKATIILAPVSSPRTPGSLIAKIPVKGGGTSSSPTYYTVEFRRPLNWDQGISHDTVLIHEMRLSPRPSEGDLRSFLVRRVVGDSSVSTDPNVDSESGGTWLPGQVFQDTANSVRISIDAFKDGTATITISNDVSTPPGPTTGGGNNCDSGGCAPYVGVTVPTLTASGDDRIPDFAFIRSDGRPVTLTAYASNPGGPDIPGSSVAWSRQAADSSWTSLGTGLSISVPLTVGDYHLKVSAMNALEAVAEERFDLHICDATSCAPHVTIFQPSSGSHVGAGVSFTMSGQAVDPNGETFTSDQITWTANGSLLGNGLSLTRKLATPGTYTITLSARDKAGFTGTASVTLIVDPVATAPSVSIVAPTDGTTFDHVTAAGVTVILVASGSPGVVRYDWSIVFGPSLGSGQTLTVTLYPYSTANCAVTSVPIALLGTQADGKQASAGIILTLRADCIK